MRIPELLASLPPAPQEGPVFLVNTMHGVHVGPFTTRGDADLARQMSGLSGWLVVTKASGSDDRSSLPRSVARMSIGKTEVVIVCDGPQCESRAYGRTAGAARDSARHPDFGWYVLAGKGGFDFCSGECEQRFIEDVVAETRAREAKK